MTGRKGWSRGLLGFEAGRARFHRLGRRYSTPLEDLLSFRPQGMFVREGLAFTLGEGLMVFDVRYSGRPRRAGYFSTAITHDNHFDFLAPLPDGRVLLGGR